MANQIEIFADGRNHLKPAKNCVGSKPYTWTVVEPN